MIKNDGSRKFISALLAMVMAFICLMPLTVCVSYAEGEEFVFDDAGALKSDQVTILDTRCSWFAKDGLNLIIATEFNSSMSAAELADTYQNMLAEGNGLVFCGDPDNDDLAFRAYGTAQDSFDELTCSTIESNALTDLDTNDFYKACKGVIKSVSDHFYYGYEPSSPEYIMPSVCDYAEYLTDDEITKLTERLDGLREKYDFDAAICIDNVMWGDTAMEAADDTYDYYLYGAGANDDGMIFYISKEPRNYWISTHAYGETVCNDRGIAYMKTLVEPKLKSDEYYEACVAYADGVEELLQMAADGKPYNKKVLDKPRIQKAVLIGVILGFIVSLIIAFSRTSHAVKLMNTARAKADAHGYMKPGSFDLQVNQDVFLYSDVSRTEKEQRSSSSSGGGGSHISSSGRSHGGGGGSY